jgi:hypothetical protein
MIEGWEFEGDSSRQRSCRSIRPRIEAMKTSAPTYVMISGFLAVCHQAGLAAAAFHQFLAPFAAPALTQVISILGKLGIAACYVHFGWHGFVWILKALRWCSDRALRATSYVEKKCHRFAHWCLEVSAKGCRSVGVGLLRRGARLRRWLAKSNPCLRQCTKALATTCTTPNCPLRV